MQELDEKAVSGEVAGMLVRYAEILDLEERLKEEKVGLRERLFLAMTEHGLGRFKTQVGDQTFKVSRREKVEVVYDEEALAARLGDRYHSILRVDPKKVRKHLKEVEPLLAGKLDLVGTPNRDRVKDSIESGALRVEDFSGTFEKKVSRVVYVSRVRERND